MERRLAAVLLLVVERWVDGNVHLKFAAGGVDANLGIGRARLLVRSQLRIHADSVNAESALYAGAWRHGILSRRRRVSRLRSRIKIRTFISENLIYMPDATQVA